ncbi:MULTISPECIES: NADH-quinone oxidoreductase subunit J [unclassified Fibrobacter]|uniref:NADH-quinone oxidoreductase subunit J family protein n=1 Tax=unclassified Fibrobacter TaxID=2634177 RepID=UPI000D6B4151|nr:MULTISPECIES: NADH-quinone oxidoreductase subunit J [unclassified Fibrobacter]PWJ71965.1 NADH dehydrogenase subunit J [Fibrobacter sp. UWR4]PZW70415.1 NADH dehydrogenase subunit J [Fibrobacter sp. UWR1]
MLENLLNSIPQAFPHSGVDIAFYAVAFVMIVMAICTVAVKSVLKSAVFLIFTFVGTAILYMLLQAEFIALAQIMVYVGGVVIFVVFTILLTSHLGEDNFSVNIPRISAAFILSAAFIAVMVKCLLPMPELVSMQAAAPEGFASLKSFALRLLDYGPNGFIIPFEIVSVLLLMTLIAAVTIAHKEKEEKK